MRVGIGQWINHISWAPSGVVILPSGGTWVGAGALQDIPSGNTALFTTFGPQAGGTQVAPAWGHGNWALFMWRIS